MKPFDLGLAKMGYPVQTRDGRSARIVCYNVKATDEVYPLMVLITERDGFEYSSSYDVSGAIYKDNGFESGSDLFMAETLNVDLHIDDFVDFGTHPRKDQPAGEHEARWFFFMHRLPAMLQMEFEDKIKPLTLFCDYLGVRYRVTGASRMGDVWLTEDFSKDTGYDKRVSVNKCSNWGEKP